MSRRLGRLLRRHRRALAGVSAGAVLAGVVLEVILSAFEREARLEARIADLSRQRDSLAYR